MWYNSKVERNMERLSVHRIYLCIRKKPVHKKNSLLFYKNYQIRVFINITIGKIKLEDEAKTIVNISET